MRGRSEREEVMVTVMARGRPRRNEETAEGKSCMMGRLLDRCNSAAGDWRGE